MKKTILLTALFCQLFLVLKSQYQLGIRADNYAGINSTLLNPAGYMMTPLSWDANIVEGHAFVLNNYAFYENSSLLSLAASDEPHIYGPNNRLRDKPLEGNVFEYYEDDRERYAIQHSGAMGPSLFFRLNANHSLGLITRLRSTISLTGIPNELSFYKYNDLLDDESFTLQKTNAGALVWSEVGLNYLYQKETGIGMFGIGITLKFLNGIEGAYVFNPSPITLFNIQGDSLRSSTGEVEFAYTESAVNNTDLVELDGESGGFGIAADIGFSLAGGQNEYSGYKWKLGASLLDIGQISFNGNSNLHRISVDSDVEFGGAVYRTYDRIEETDEALRFFSFQVLGDSTASLVGDSFSMWLPSAASLQFDYAVTKQFFVNATVVQGVPIGRNGVRRTNIIGLSPRYESRWFSIAVPFTYYNFDQFRYGLAGRLGPLFVGTDDLGNLVSRSDLNGADFYIGLKLSPLLFGGGKGDNAVGGGSRNGKNTVRCPQF